MVLRYISTDLFSTANSEMALNMEKAYFKQRNFQKIINSKHLKESGNMVNLYLVRKLKNSGFIQVNSITISKMTKKENIITKLVVISLLEVLKTTLYKKKLSMKMTNQPTPVFLTQNTKNMVRDQSIISTVQHIRALGKTIKNMGTVN